MTGTQQFLYPEYSEGSTGILEEGDFRLKDNLQLSPAILLLVMVKRQPRNTL